MEIIIFTCCFVGAKNPSLELCNELVLRYEPTDEGKDQVLYIFSAEKCNLSVSLCTLCWSCSNPDNLGIN